MNTFTRLRRIEEKINTKQKSKFTIWPIFEGASAGEPYRDITLHEVQMLVNKRQPVPICIALSREKEFLEYLEIN